MLVKWVAICPYCGKRGSMVSRSDLSSPRQTSMVSGNCPNTIGKKHAATWQRMN